ncbi:unnamed protein product [Rotaria sp. Silwood2]|nr:unnamed protein product [Rotaria sp. Silwood2]
MQKALISFDIDLTKMRLGKLSKNQLDKAYTVLTKLQTLITSGVTTSKTAIIDASNRFYTLIPHNCDLGSLPLLDNIELITFETKMIDNLREIEIAYSMLDESNNTIDSIDHDSEEFKLIEQYMINTHDAYTLKLCELFKTKREEEFDLFKKFQTIDNHQLLWRGSRTTDFACILSQRLRISPPEAPVTGFMLGKGVYFADMCSKSEYHYKNDGVLIPMSHGIPSGVRQIQLLYNEYIVYDTEQINMKYLLRLDFQHKLLLSDY